MKDAWRHFTAEFIGTFALVFIGGGAIVTSPLLQGQSVVNIALAHGIILGILVTATMRTSGILRIGPLTGGSMNPARSFGPAIVTKIFQGQAAYWIGPFLGGISAALLYDKLLMPRMAEPADHGAVRPVG